MYDIEASLCATGCMPACGLRPEFAKCDKPLDAPECIPSGGATCPFTGYPLDRDERFNPEQH